MNAFQHFIADIARHPMCLVESTKHINSKNAQTQLDRRTQVLSALGNSTLSISDLMELTDFTRGQLEHMLLAMQAESKVCRVDRSSKRLALWSRK